MGKLLVEAEGMLITEPEQRVTGTGKEVWNARLAVTERIKDKESGDWRNGESIVFTIVDFNGNLESFVKKDVVLVTGRVSKNKWIAKDGLEREELKLFSDNILEVRRVPSE
jgi:single-strand DNA-binding protein